MKLFFNEKIFKEIFPATQTNRSEKGRVLVYFSLEKMKLEATMLKFYHIYLLNVC